MDDSYRQFFALKSEPFRADIKRGDIMVTQALSAVQDRVQYAVRLGAVALITGEIGSGKSTALRYVIGDFHPSEYRIIYITATSGSILELYRQILAEMGIDVKGVSKATMTRLIKLEILESRSKKIKIALMIDEASLLRLEVFAELHTLTQFEQDSKPFLPIILSGQINLVDNLQYRNSLPLASRVIAKSHLKGIDLKTMDDYLRHHLAIAGVKQMLFDDAAVTAIHQGSGGLLRKANHLARGAIIAAARKKSTTVTAEHVRLAATEIL
ncbi:MAG: AAA family ATPase [Syntrophobacterales bacterium]|nr:AAA family ATPase [Syntrophobacterales bacterium]